LQIKLLKMIKNVLILGVTFKENCPDMRNSKVLDIIDELKECNIEVFDPWVDKSDKHLHFLDSLPLNSNKYDSIIVAVGHEQFKTISTEDYNSMSNKEVIDVKGIVEKPTWRL